MTEHEKLKAICDEIGYRFQPNEKWYKPDGIYQKGFYGTVDCGLRLNVREIIFTQEFMGKLKIKLSEKYNIETMEFDTLLMKKLDNPVDYLYKILELG